MVNPRNAIAEAPISDGHSVFVQGAHGSGKSACLAQRIRVLRRAGVPAHAVLVLIQQRDRCRLFSRHLMENSGGVPAPAQSPSTADFLTYNGLASRAVRLFWPVVAGAAGFSRPHHPPVFLTYETAQYLMGQIIAPRLARGYFEGLSMRPQRVLSQLLDNLNKAAVNGYPIDTVGDRLRRAWTGDAYRVVYLEQAQECADAFRTHCLRQGLVDFSMVVELLDRHLVCRDDFWVYLSGRYRHLLVDQLEETVPVAQDLIRRFLPACDSSCLFYDPRGGYRVFMGIDAAGALDLAAACTVTVELPEPPDTGPTALARALERRIGGAAGPPKDGAGPAATAAVAGRIACHHRADMIAQVAAEVVRLVGDGVPAGEIAVVAPHADGVLRHLLGRELSGAQIPFSASRRFAALREEPVARLGLTLASLAHPDWQAPPHPWDVTHALAYVTGLDAVRAALACRHLYDGQTGRLLEAGRLADRETDRIGAGALARIAAVIAWIETCRASVARPPLDHFLRRLFGEVVSRPKTTPDEASAYARLVTAAARFHEAAPAMGLSGPQTGRQFAQMVWDGVVAAAPVESARHEEPVLPEGRAASGDPHGAAETATGAAEAGAVLLVAPVYTYLLQPRRARYQFWLDVGSMRWWEPPHQPLTNPHVLSRSWPPGDRWTDAVDYETRNRTLRRLVHGLCRRCTEAVYLCSSEVEESGEPQDSPLLRAFDRIGAEG